MKKLGILLTFMVIVSHSLLSNGAEPGFRKILGIWEFTAPNAPQPYNGGILTLKEVDQKLTGSFTVQGQSLPIPTIDFADNILSMEFDVENSPISLKLTLKNGVFEGTTETTNGQVTVSAKPATQDAK